MSHEPSEPLVQSHYSDRRAITYINHNVKMLTIAVIVLAIVLALYIIVECVVLVYSLYKRNKGRHHKDLEGVVVKGESRKQKRRSKKSSKGKKEGSKKSSSSAKKTKSNSAKTATKKSAKTSKTGSVESKTGRSSKASDSAPSKTDRPKAQRKLSASSESVKSAKELQPTASNLRSKKSGPKDYDSTADVTTQALIAQIPPQFPVSADNSVEFTTGMSTPRQIAELPPQFESSSQQSRNSPSFIAEVAKQVSEFLTARATTPPSPSSVEPQQIINPSGGTTTTPLDTPKTRTGTSTSTGVTPTQQVDQAQQPVYTTPQQQATANQVKGSVYLDLGMNGETAVTSPTVADNQATNSLIIDGNKMAPIDGRPQPNQPSTPGPQ